VAGGTPTLPSTLLRPELRLSVSLQRQQGHHCDWLDADEVKAQWPWLGPSHGALWAPREGAIDPLVEINDLLVGIGFDDRSIGTLEHVGEQTDELFLLLRAAAYLDGYRRALRRRWSIATG
jgi:glycine/D-amino acid oxidase-like deaminating enzyme